MTSRIGHGKTGSQQALAKCLLIDHRADGERVPVLTTLGALLLTAAEVGQPLHVPQDLSIDGLGTLGRDIVPLCSILNSLHKVEATSGSLGEG